MTKSKLSTASTVCLAILTLLLIILPLRIIYAQPGGQTGVIQQARFGIPKQNTAIYLGWQGHIDTQFDFSTFFDSDHTIVAWFMPQYPHAKEGPIFAENGGGTYLVGQYDYRQGDVGPKLGDPGNPVLFIQVGQQKVLYLVPEWEAGKWQHIAVVRQSNTFKLYINGNYQTPDKDIDKETDGSSPDSDITVSSSFAYKPNGTLRFGRRTTGTNASMLDWQAYGLLDDVAVFNKALNASEINLIRSKKRLGGWESHLGLLAGWSFDTPASNEKPLPPLLNSWRQDSTRTYRVSVSSDRNNSSDSEQFNTPSIIGETQVALRLPFYAYEVWYVVQGYDDPGGSHNGYAAFSYDFRRYEPNYNGSNPQEYSNGGTSNAPLLSASSGKIVGYLKDGPLDEGREPNRAWIRQAEGEYISYLHLAPNSLPSNVSGGSCDANGMCTIPEATAPSIQQCSLIGKVGPKAYHLHFAGFNRIGTTITIPVAFTNYQAFDENKQKWVPVVRGHPKAEQRIRRLPTNPQACQGITGEIGLLKKEKGDLQQELQLEDSPQRKSDIANQIKALITQIEAKKKELEKCLMCG